VDLIEGEYTALPARALTEETCRKFRYTVGRMKHPKTRKVEDVHIATYCDDMGRPVGQKIRFRDKEMMIVGDSKAVPKMLYGRWLFRDGGKKIVITEGEIDALTVSQLQGNKWPVVSIPNGAQHAHKAIAANLDWLTKFDEVVLMFDNDAAGIAAVEACAPLFPAGKCKVAHIEGYKDANEAHVAKQGQRVIDAMWGAKEYRPDGIVGATDENVLARALKKVEFSTMTWPWPTLQRYTYGRRFTEMYALGAGTGLGKTTVFKQWQAHVLEHDPDPIGVFALEEPVHHSARTLAGVIDGVRYHVPGVEYDEAQLEKTLRSFEGRVYFYDHVGGATYETVIEKMRYMRHALGVRHFFLDNLTALAATMGDDERKAIDRMMADFGALMIELDSCLYFISHLTTPEGKSHEEGGRVKENQLRGSRSIAFWAHFIFAVEGDKQKIGSPRKFRILKDRNTGDGNGIVFGLQYDRTTGRLVEVELDDEDNDGPFGDESNKAF
jgi:twinkle protein